VIKMVERLSKTSNTWVKTYWSSLLDIMTYSSCRDPRVFEAGKHYFLECTYQGQKELYRQLKEE
jgi:hypothetical protein